MNAKELKAKADEEISMFEKLSKLTAVSMVKMLMSQENKIAELEKENTSLNDQNKRVCTEVAELEKDKDELNIQIEVLKHSDAEYYGLYSELLFSPNEPPESLEAHNLEQQVKGVNAYADNLKVLPWLAVDGVDARTAIVLAQLSAKALKEGKQ
jgi:predicted nuclease with TOPRIM domain